MPQGKPQGKKPQGRPKIMAIEESQGKLQNMGNMGSHRECHLESQIRTMGNATREPHFGPQKEHYGKSCEYIREQYTERA